MKKCNSKLNLGWGKQMSFAGKNALRNLYGQGHYATVASHSSRWNQFVEFSKNSLNISDVAKIDIDHIESYASYVARRAALGEVAVAYGQNLLSSVNTTLEALKGKRDLYISPSKWIGERSTIREIPPIIDKDLLSQAILEMNLKGLVRGACAAQLARELGLRSKESFLINPKKALREFSQSSEITISSGTKGGLTRKLKILHESQIQALQNSSLIQRNASNLIPIGCSWSHWKEGELRECREILKEHGIPGFHELRAAYACERYQEITGHKASVFGFPIENREVDYEARLQIANELGHGRIDVLSEYIGGRK